MDVGVFQTEKYGYCVEKLLPKVKRKTHYENYNCAVPGVVLCFQKVVQN